MPAVLAELLDAGKLHADILTCNGKTVRENVEGKHSWDRRTIKKYSEPLVDAAGFLHMTGNLFDSAIMKTSVITKAFREAFLEDPKDPNAFEAKAIVFDGPEDYHARIETADVDERTILVMRGAGPLGYPGAAEVVNMTGMVTLQVFVWQIYAVYTNYYCSISSTWSPSQEGHEVFLTLYR